MYLSLSTTHRPASDLGYLLAKHPDRLHEFELTFGRACVFFPQADEDRCEATLVLDVDPVGIVRGRGGGEGLLDAYVNDRPYAASSFLSVALNRAFRSAMAGASRERPELAQTPIPLEVVVTPLPSRAEDARALFEPLGWRVTEERLAGDAGPSRYVTLKLSGEMRLSDALAHLYVLIPALDGEKHYWIADDEVEKLLKKGEGWLAAHPQQETIARRYLKNRPSLVQAALERLAPEVAVEEDAPPPAEERIEKPIRLDTLRRETVLAALKDSGAAHVVDLGCGEGKLLTHLLRDRRFTRIVGLDASARALERAAIRCKTNRADGPKEGRLTLLHGALTYRDARWKDAEAATLVEVIEHLDPDRLPMLEDVVFGDAAPKTVIVTTPNIEYNVLFEGLAAGALRHADHRFEWTRAEFAGWAARIEERYGYRAAISGIGELHDEHGAPTQMAVFSQ